MTHLYEREAWIPHAISLDRSSFYFSLLTCLFGMLGMFAAALLLTFSLISFDDMALYGIFASIGLGIQSFVLFVFGVMMRAMSKVIIANFEMALADTRKKLGTNTPD